MTDNLSTYQDKLTLDEVSANDLEMVKDAIKNANKYGFGRDARKAVLFIRTCMDATMKRLGIKVNPPTTKESKAKYAKWLDKEMANRQIRIEHRNKYRGEDIWRCGIYVYQRDELVCFTSDVLTERRTEFDPISQKIGRDDAGFVVITNAKLDETNRIFLMPTAGRA